MGGFHHRMSASFSTLHRVVGGETSSTPRSADSGNPVSVLSIESLGVKLTGPEQFLNILRCFSTLHRVVGGETDDAGGVFRRVVVSVLSIESLGVKRTYSGGSLPLVYRFSTLHRVVGGETWKARRAKAKASSFSTLHRVVGGETGRHGRCRGSYRQVSVLSIESLGVKPAGPRR